MFFSITQKGNNRDGVSVGWIRYHLVYDIFQPIVLFPYPVIPNRWGSTGPRSAKGSRGDRGGRGMGGRGGSGKGRVGRGGRGERGRGGQGSGEEMRSAIGQGSGRGRRHEGRGDHCLEHYPECAKRDENGNILLVKHNWLGMDLECALKILRDFDDPDYPLTGRRAYQALRFGGPMMGTILATDEFINYTGGVIKYMCDRNVDMAHSITIVGMDSGKRSFMIQNSDLNWGNNRDGVLAQGRQGEVGVTGVDEAAVAKGRVREGGVQLVKGRVGEGGMRVEGIIAWR
ncbi:hypothetical protein POM88_000110 [Heracleum sosnowskyi]|uniref:Uncharacterized protein n=1 Tax=Heracleum sosnowskyi TaxID=360622 RepID=A0AAD8J9P6_9APIA|nr:hypothetical protein POM88_000110 [Heracleum sosnowskyi]